MSERADPTSRTQKLGRHHRAPIGAGVLVLASILALVACAGSPAVSTAPTAAPASSPSPAASASPQVSGPAASPDAVQDLAITGTDFAFEAPTTIPGGPTRITLTNAGEEEHQAQLAGLIAGKTLADLTVALQGGNETAALALLALSGGPTGVQPGASGSTTSNLAPGQYAFLCFVQSADGVPHLAKGMIAPIQVTEPASTAELPSGDVELALQDFAFVGLDTLSAGEHTVTVKNDGPQAHEATIVKLSEGIEAAELIPMFTSSAPPAGGPPFTSAGGVAGIAPGETALMEVDLEPGNYAYLCFVPDPASGAPHVALGMVGALTVE